VQLSEVHHGHAVQLHTELTAAPVTEFVPPPPPSIEGFEHFAAWARQGREQGTQLCFSVSLPAENRVVGVMALQLPPPGYDLWNWGFALGTRAWGTGVFREAAGLLLAFAGRSMALDAVEAWILHANGRANSAISKLGAVSEFRANAKAPDGRVADFMRWTVRTEK
jgi:RimJ/RimL family protein N-acetyltransferase